MAQLTDSELTASLDGLSAGLAADGYTLDAHWTAEGRVEIAVDATPDACADCLVPKDVMRGIAVSMLSDAGASVGEEDVTVTYPEGSAAH